MYTLKNPRKEQLEKDIHQVTDMKSLPEILNELELLRLYQRYKISLTWAMETGYFKHAHFHSIGFCRVHLFPSQIMSFEQWKYHRPTGTYLGINIQ